MTSRIILKYRVGLIFEILDIEQERRPRSPDKFDKFIIKETQWPKA